ncbi:MAG TPA: EF-hand domain-containing protein [Caulobacteraceae bacterium]|nr:EF-hand domain-containing protein [Caulobacteraceae bacterium]
MVWPLWRAKAKSDLKTPREPEPPMTRLKIAAATVILAGWAGAASAQDFAPPLGGPPPAPRRALDRREIFLSPAGEPFRAPPGQPYPVAVWFAQADANHDGQITREEFRADFDRFFQVLDENHDGVIDGFEVEDYERKVAPEVLSVLERQGFQGRASDEGPGGPGQDGGGPGSGQGPGGGGGGRGGRGERGGMGGGGGPGGDRNAGPSADTARLQVEGAAAYSLLSISEPVGAADANIDGKITLAEFRAAADRRFDLLDPKHLGYLTLADLPKTPAQLAEIKDAKARAKMAGQGGPGGADGARDGGGPPPSP